MKHNKRVSRFPELATDVFLGLTCSFFLLWPGSNGYSAIQQAKFGLFCLLFGGYLAVMLLYPLESRIVGEYPPGGFRKFLRSIGPVQWIILGYWLLSGISAVFSDNFPSTLLGLTRDEGLFTLTLYCGAFFCVSLYGKPKPWLPYLFGGTMCLCCILGLLQMQGLNLFGLYPGELTFFDGEEAYAGQYLTTIGNADLVAALLTMTVPLCGILALRSREKTRFLLLIPMVLSIVTLLQLNVQAGLVGTGLGLLLCIPNALPMRKKWPLWMAVAAVLIGGLVWIWYYPGESGTFYEFSKMLHGQTDDRFGNGRILIWRTLLKEIPQHLWFGTGPDTMAAARYIGYSYHTAQGESVPYIFDVAHNEYLNVLYHQGAFALAAYLGVLACSFRRWLCSREPMVLAAGGAVLCYCIQAFFGFSMCSVSGLFWALLAIVNTQETEEKS